MTYLHRALKDGHALLKKSGSKTRIVYVVVDHSEIYDDPEEQVRAEYWAELIYRYGYPPERIGVEVTVPDRTPKDAADLVVFNDDDRKDPFAVIECKREGVSDAEFDQAVEQAAGNGAWAKLRALYIGVVAGVTRRFLDVGATFPALEREKNVIADLPSEYGEPEEFKFRKGRDPDIEPVSKAALIQAIKKSHQTLWAGGRLSPPQAFSELCKLIFVKIADEQTKRKIGEPYQFQIKTHESAKSLGRRIRELYAAHKKRDPMVFTDTILASDSTLLAIVSHLESINLSATDLDVKGVAFEQFMDGFFKGDFGQYFTPREIIEFAVDMVEPTSDDRVLDPSCGSGGFLLYALDAVREEAGEYHSDPESAEFYRHWHDFAEKELFGIEINDEICRVAKMNMIIHDDGHSNVAGADALQSMKKLSALNPGLVAEGFDVILTNPPFGASIKADEQPYLSEYEFGLQKATKKGKRPVRKSQKTEVLFIERVWSFLKPNGRAAIVLPDGILSNQRMSYVRSFILTRFQVLAVVSLPVSAFAHYGAGVKASLVFLRKRSSDEVPADDEVTFMAAPEKIGYDATGRATANELPTVLAEYRKFLKDPEKFSA